MAPLIMSFPEIREHQIKVLLRGYSEVPGIQGKRRPLVETDELFQQRMRDLVLELRADEQLSYKELALRLEKQGLVVHWKTLANRVQTGKFSAGFALAVLHALGVKKLTLKAPTSRLRVNE
jgi:hypothetical protein